MFAERDDGLLGVGQRPESGREPVFEVVVCCTNGMVFTPSA